MAKVKKAMAVDGPSFLHIFAPCPTGWRYPPDKTLEMARMATHSKIFPLYEVENGVYTVKRFKKEAEVEKYLMMQGRFRHLKKEEIDSIRDNVELSWRTLLRKEEMTKDLG